MQRRESARLAFKFGAPPLSFISPPGSLLYCIVMPVKTYQDPALIKSILTSRSAGRSIAIALAGLLCAFQASAQPEAPRRTGVVWLDWAADQIAFALREAEPAPPGTEVAPAPSPATHSIESMEIYRLQQEIRQLRELIEDNLLTRMMALEVELRDVKIALGTRQDPGYAGGPVVPRPDDLPRSFGAPVPQMPREESAELRHAAEALPPAAPFSFSVLDEWGRSPEVAEELGGDASTLIGLVGVVPARSDKTDVMSLARELREKYEGYDNINIEVFDTNAAAQAYIDRQAVDAAHHVASISRHKASGRDLVLYLGGGAPEPVPLGAE